MKFNLTKLKLNLFGYVLIGFMLVMMVKIYMDSGHFKLKCIISDVDGNKYCVREREKLELVANKLARTTQKLRKVVDHIGEKYPDRENVKRLVKGFNPKKIYEILPTSKYTAYSENKGQKLAFCVTKTKEGDNLIDDNTLMFVALHEISHIATKSIGHKQEFWDNFKFILEEAVEIKVYKPVDYKKKPISYCSLNITDNPYFDM